MNSNGNYQSGAVGGIPARRGPLALRRIAAEQIENTKAAIVSEFRDKLEEHRDLLRLALNEAEALAWQAGFAHLFFPLLAAEKAQAVASWHARQRSIRRMNERLAFAA